MRIAISLGVLAACSANGNSGAVDAPGQISSDAPIVDSAGDGPASGALPALAFCTVSDPSNLAAAFTTTTDGQYVHYDCATPCSGDWTTCTFGWVDGSGTPVSSARGALQLRGLAFVVDGMGGHFAFTPDGDDVVVSHAGAGGVTNVNKFDGFLQSASTLKTVSLGWMPGTSAIQAGNGGAGWFTRTDANPTSVHDLTARPAAALAWVKANLAGTNRLGTVGGSMGTAATFGAHVWQGLDSILDYQMLIGGPGFWDVNVGCGRVHVSAGHCDVDAAPCTGNPNSSFGNQDPACPGGAATDSCRVPTVMAPIGGNSPTGSAYDDIINYVGETTACSPLMTDARDPALDASSMATTVASWSFRGKIEFTADEGGVQPPDADQGMGEGHMLDIYTQIQSAKAWYDDDGQHHTDSFDKIAALMQTAAARVIAGMGH